MKKLSELSFLKTLLSSVAQRPLICKLLLLAISILLFAVASPVTAFFCFVPVLFLIEKTSMKKVWLWGGIYNSLSYFFYAFWLFSFSKIAMAGVCVVYFIYGAMLFFFLKLAEKFWGNFAILAQTLIFVFYEYLKTLGFLGFSYGILGYTQYKNLYLIQIADIFGVFGVSAILFLSSGVIKMWLECCHSETVENSRSYLQLNFYCRLRRWLPHLVMTSFFIIAILASLIYGGWKMKKVQNETKNAKKITVAAIQNNADPWKSGIEEYKNDVASLISLSKQALKENPEISLVVWPETSIVPSIMKNYVEENSLVSSTLNERNKLIESTLRFFDESGVAFVVGNFHSIGEDDFNSAFLFESGKNVIPPRPEIYSKVHLVPFSESFPYGEIFPHFYKLLLNGDTHLWTAGKERKVFDLDGFRFATPICFEDTFGSDCKKFVKNGANAFVNLSNDAWSKSSRCQKQHLQMAVFRSVENHVPTVRSTASGTTCFIDATGKITKQCREFEKGFVVGEM